MENDKRAIKAAWSIWLVFVVAYLGFNYHALSSDTFTRGEVVIGFGIAMPIICNLAWWAVGFRLRSKISYWWIYGFLTAVVLGISGFVTMWVVAKGGGN